MGGYDRYDRDRYGGRDDRGGGKGKGRDDRDRDGYGKGGDRKGGGYGDRDRYGGKGGGKDDRDRGYGGGRDGGRDDRDRGYGGGRDGGRDDRDRGYGGGRDGGRDDRDRGYGGGRDDRDRGYGGGRDDRREVRRDDRDRGYGGGKDGGRDDRDRGYGGGRDDRDRGGKGGRDDRDRGGKGGKGGDRKGGKKGGGKKGKRRSAKEEEMEKALDAKQGCAMNIASAHFPVSLSGKVVRVVSISFKNASGSDEGACGPQGLGLKESDPTWEAILNQVMTNMHKQMKSEEMSIQEVRASCVAAGNVIYLRNPSLLPAAGFEAFTLKVRVGRTFNEYTVSLSGEKDIALGIDDQESVLSVQTMVHNILQKTLRSHYTTMCPKTKKLLNAGSTEGGMTIMKGVRPKADVMCNDDQSSLFLELEPCVKVTSNVRMDQLLKTQSWVSLVGCGVLTPHNNMLYKFRKELKETAKESTFMRKGESLGLIDYFNTAYGIKIPDDDKIIEVKTGEGRKCVLPASICCCDFLTPDQKGSLPSICSLQPAARFDMISEALKVLGESSTTTELEKWGINIDTTSLMRHKATRLAPTKLVIGSQKSAEKTGNFGRTLMGFRFDPEFPKGSMESFVVGSDGRSLGDGKRRWQAIEREMQKVSAPFSSRVVGDREGRSLGKVLEESKLGSNGFVFAALRDGDKYEYSEVKEWCIKNGIVSQCQNLSKTERSKAINVITANFAKQVCNKKGLLSWWTPLEESIPYLADKAVMIVGVDVNRMDAEFAAKDDKIEKSFKAFAGFVAWVYDPSKTGADRWRHYCDVITKSHKDTFYMEQPGEGESRTGTSEGGKTSAQDFASTGSKLHDFLVAAGKHFLAEGTAKIDEIIVMRDGGSTGNIDAIQDMESRQLEDAALSTDAFGTRPATTFLLLNKRPKTRFLADSQTTADLDISNGDGHFNVPRGIVVNSLTDRATAGTTHSTFWLIACSCDLSTTIPTKYVVLGQQPSDSGDVFPVEEIPRLCFDLGWMYPNWPDAVKVCIFVFLFVCHRIEHMNERKKESNVWCATARFFCCCVSKITSPKNRFHSQFSVPRSWRTCTPRYVNVLLWFQSKLSSVST